MINKLIQNQKSFFESQVTKSIEFRKKSLKKLLINIEKYENEIYDCLKNDLNKHKFESFVSEVYLVKKEIKYFIKNISSWSKTKKVKSSILNFYSKDYLTPEPYGLTLHISPWNYPFQLSLNSLIGAVGAGNTVVLKPSENSPHTSKLIKKIINESFNQEHVEVILGNKEVASELLEYKWDYIFFTGSTEIGKIVASKAANKLTPYTLELGGKNPCIVDETVPIGMTAKRIVWGKFLNCGQTCIAPDFIVVNKLILEKLIEKIKYEIEISFGKNPQNSSSYGRIINEKHLKRLESYLKKEKNIIGGKINYKAKYLEPTIVIDPNLESKVMKTEIFGPILPILSYNNSSDLHNILSKNNNPLAFYIFSKNKKFIDKILKKYSFGGASINDTIIQFLNDKLPFGGIGESGTGSYHGKHSFNTFTHFKSIVKKPFFKDIWLRFPPYPNKFNLIKSILNKI